MEPVTLTIYKNGVYEVHFKSEINIEEGEITLKVSRKKLDNVLKTLLIQGKDIVLKEIKISKLDTWKPSINPNSALLALLSSLIGKKIQIQLSDGVVTGTLLGIEQSVEIPTQTGVSVIKGVVMLTGDRVKVYPLMSIEAITLPEENRRILSDYFDIGEDYAQIKIIVKGIGKKEINIKYVDIGTGWTPNYRLYITKEKTWIMAFAQVRNETSYDWKGVKLIFSTATPKLEEVMPPRLPVIPKVAKRAAFEEAEEKVLAEALPAFEESEIKSLKTLGMAIQNFVIENVNLKQKETKLLPLFAREIQAEPFSLWITDNDFAYKKLMLKNNTDVHIVSGNMSIYIDDTFIGSVRLSNVPINDEKEVTVDVDKRIKVMKVQQLIKTTTGLIRQGVKKAYETMLKIENLSDENIKIKVMDRPPEGILKPEIIDATKLPDTFENGYYIWNLELNPKEKLEIKFTYLFKE